MYAGTLEEVQEGGQLPWQACCKLPLNVFLSSTGCWSSKLCWLLTKKGQHELLALGKERPECIA